MGFRIFLLVSTILCCTCNAYNLQRAVNSGFFNSMFDGRILKANVTETLMKIIENQLELNGLDVIGRKYFNGSSEIYFRAASNSIKAFELARVPYRIALNHTNEFHKDKLGIWHRYNELTAENKITFKRYLTYKEIENFLESLPSLSTSSRRIRLESIGKSVENRNILMVKIEHPNAKPIAFFDAGIHAREWLSIMTAIYLITRLVSNETHPELNKINWYIIPTINPDGYIYSTEKNRLHRKNRNFSYCNRRCSCGVDLNRNFGFHFGESGVSKDPCFETYPGPYAFSEPESRALRDVLNKYRTNIKLYVNLHSFGRLILYPWGYKREKCQDWKDLEIAAMVAAKSIRDYSRDPAEFKVLSSGIDFYPASGAADDYAKGVVGIKYSYTMELQEGGETGFEPPEELIEDFVNQNYIGITKMAEYVVNISLKACKTNRSFPPFPSKASKMFTFSFTVYLILIKIIN